MRLWKFGSGKVGAGWERERWYSRGPGDVKIFIWGQGRAGRDCVVSYDLQMFEDSFLRQLMDSRHSGVVGEVPFHPRIDAACESPSVRE